MTSARKAEIERKTGETDISVSLLIDGSGQGQIATGIPFFDHMLTLFARHSLTDLTVRARGDIEVDLHHTVEDAGIALGHPRVGRPVPALVLPIILFMGVHEYSLARGAAVAFVLGYATDVLGIAPVGLYTCTYVATFVLARAAGVRLATQTTWMQVLLAGAFALLQSTMVLVLLAIFGRDAWAPRSLYPLALPHAIATASVAPVIFRFAQSLHVATGSSTRADARVPAA